MAFIAALLCQFYPGEGSQSFDTALPVDEQCDGLYGGRRYWAVKGRAGTTAFESHFFPTVLSSAWKCCAPDE